MTERHRVIDAAIIPPRLETTPEGFLICRDVPLARTGEQTYYAHELPSIPAKNGQIIAVRDEDEVFSEAAIESFRGKPFTDDHPDEDVDTKNWRTLMRGVVMNPRRGEGELSDRLLGDIMVYDPTTIAKIRAGKREVSNGYDADYEAIEPGRARQIRIRGNHVSLVDEGRCGPSCAIRDRKPLMTNRKTSIGDILRRAFKAKDEAAREEVLAEADAGMSGDESAHEGDGHHIVVNVGSPPPAKPEGEGDQPNPNDPDGLLKDEEGDPEENKDMDEEKVKALIAEANAPIMEALTALTDKIEPLLPKITETVERVEELSEAVDDMADPEDMATQDAVARAAILAPSLNRPTNDAKPGSKSHRDAMSSFKRDALKAALTTDAGRSAVGAVLGHVQSHRIAAMTPAEVNVAFRASSQMMLDSNAARTVDTLQSATSGYVRDDKGQRQRAMTPADLQARANAYYKRG
ncbi:putative bacteriophage protein [Methylorubrum populi]|uniref:Putative bacteriophage protein n=1 Tax=Methylorubrum populi TaxID=223967 RepID=A0A160PIP2_9HYPH|nr:DUF2213 domain-containing protein [Methylorubrum populi]BAU93397.1 putative bacteriophage protein [Methylorubrum populi]